ncbi:2-phosphosulfolactate phosphatase [Sporosarcina pasteurii]|uniref:Probable 2-phosphosulfolactate phosphatase n=1 Tax=Sporosarcina pasteurii TaxID=1474 RepID=A0A380C225_SPOPA|nr:2-phosphosulfolactate phosphatase [Sporosarcina pasteurii]MDS9471590.1 2-phosphosulfolactate phosphatase [Sporosarcina pasteurii]QBQ04796.1 2-phosphosulfolactate phosphatase [Sporosarcina pasteurii]SUJ11222.1 Probable 2-phosphosulfolactate phosphatase [Sporosarcina pasteurii]
MGKHKLHVLLSKEEVNPEKIDPETVVVVFDVLLATTTIAAVLQYGANEVIPVVNGGEGLKVAEGLQQTATILTGEYGGRTIEGFIEPLPTILRDLVAEKTMILSTTNGTVAIRNVTKAKNIYAASLVNASAVAKEIATNHTDKKVLLVCAGGSNRRFAMEDFYGAGCFIDKLMHQNPSWALTDSANTALLFYRGNETESERILTNSETGQMLVQMGLVKDVRFASEIDRIDVVPQFENGEMTLK